MKRRSRRTRKQKQRQPRPASNPLAEHFAKLQAIIDKAAHGPLEEAESRRLFTALETLPLVREALTKEGVTIAELRQLMWDRIAQPEESTPTQESSDSTPVETGNDRNAEEER